MGEKGNFRGRLFGGFDRQDVIDYIESVSIKKNAGDKERESLREELSTCRERVFELETERAELRREVEELKAELERERDRTAAFREEKLREADAVVDELIAQVERMKSYAAINITGAQSELKRLDKALASISAVYSDAETRLSALKGDISAKK